MDLALLVTSDETCRLDDGTGFEGSDSNRGEERSEEEVVPWGDDNDVELVSVEVLEERSSSPS